MMIAAIDTTALMTALIAAFVSVAVVVVGYFAQRVHALENRVDELEYQLEDEWRYQRQLIDVIYRAGKAVPERKKHK